MCKSEIHILYTLLLSRSMHTIMACYEPAQNAAHESSAVASFPGLAVSSCPFSNSRGASFRCSTASSAMQYFSTATGWCSKWLTLSIAHVEVQLSGLNVPFFFKPVQSHRKEIIPDTLGGGTACGSTRRSEVGKSSTITMPARSGILNCL